MRTQTVEMGRDQEMGRRTQQYRLLQPFFQLLRSLSIPMTWARHVNNFCLKVAVNGSNCSCNKTSEKSKVAKFLAFCNHFATHQTDSIKVEQAGHQGPTVTIYTDHPESRSAHH